MELLQFSDKLTEQNLAIMRSLDTLIETLALRSKDTAINYESRIRNFFRDTRNKEMEQLTFYDLEFTLPEIKRYQITLFNKGYKSVTVSSRIAAIKKFYKALSEDNIKVDASVFDIELINKRDTDRYDSLSVEEVISIRDYLKTAKHNGDQKSLLVELAMATGFRLQSLLTIRKENFFTQNNLYLVKITGKGNKGDIKQLTSDLYNRCLVMAKDGKLFTLGTSSVDRMMNDIRNHFDFGSRHIAFHSFKSSSIRYVSEQTGGDVKAMQRQGNHAKVSTTLDNYVDEYKLENLIPIDLDNVLDTKIIKEVSHGQLLNAIDKLDSQTKRRIAHLLANN